MLGGPHRTVQKLPLQYEVVVQCDQDIHELFVVLRWPGEAYLSHHIVWRDKLVTILEWNADWRHFGTSCAGGRSAGSSCAQCCGRLQRLLLV